MSKNFIVIDTETGGLNPKEHSLLSLGVVLVKDGVRVEEREYFIKKESYVVTPGAMRVNKFDFNGCVHGSTIPEIQDDLWKMMLEHFGKGGMVTALGHNIGFDLSFIHEQIMTKESWEKMFSYRNIDTAAIARFLKDAGVIDIDRVGLSDLMEYFEIGTEETEGRHSALFDAKMTLQIYNFMLELIKNKK